MKRTLSLFVVVAFLSTFALGQDLSARFDAAKMRERVKRISADEFEGRGPGSPGSEKAAAYIAGQMKASGIKPGNGSSYYQNVKLVGISVDPNTELKVSGGKGKPAAF
nr:hypothetical protein [Blastocatellia bacterium]